MNLVKAKHTTRIILLAVLVPIAALSQQKDIELPDEPDPLISFEGNVSWFFWNMKPKEDSVATILKDHYEALNRGLRLGGGIMIHLDDGFSFGLVYRHFLTSHSTPEASWIGIPLLDSNGKVMYDPVTGQLLTGQWDGKISETFKISFWGLKLRKEFDINRQIKVGFSITPGLASYREDANFAGYDFYLEGESLGIELGLTGRYKMDNNWSAFFEFSYFNCVLEEPRITDSHFSLYNHPYPETVLLNNWNVGIGISYTIVKKPRKNKSKTADPKGPENESDQERFKL